ncbi:uncharacterized protein LOC116928105 [Daphnia magna]|uniref:Cuticle protein n=1 Tax=Daphnia magna TaxID=35525 RepID=A0ABR0AKB0_9CRUS|nr:uncharacterized protein LOC116928105 [Daphnia magna]KAK4025559.1 hypothetical protein OUZ56_014622 [Daphnia magna]
MCFFKLMAFACFVAAAEASDLPAGRNPVEDAGNYTVLYNGPEGSHLQTGEPGKAVKGFYTFVDSRGRKQKVTYQADERGYRVTSTALVVETEDVSPTTRRPRIIEKITPKFQAGVLFTKKMNEPQREFLNSGILPSSTEESIAAEPKSMVPELQFKIPAHPVISTTFEQEATKTLVPPESKGQIRFKEPKVLLNYDAAYNLGYPFVDGIYVYAL